MASFWIGKGWFDVLLELKLKIDCSRKVIRLRSELLVARTVRST